ncbi:MAG: hypothetical protein RR107_05770 [Clostridia bacterium]
MFKCVKMLVGGENQPPVVYLEGTANELITEGEALTIVNGKLTKATGKPKYIAAKTQTGGIIPAFYVTPYAVFESTMSVVGTAFEVGTKLALKADMLEVADASTTATGVATVFEFVDGKAVGSKVNVIFE